jgi:hypothetical protein
MITAATEYRIRDFTPKVLTRVRALQTEFIGEFDGHDYQSERSEELMDMISESFDFLSLIGNQNQEALTDKEVNDLIDFFNDWLDLNMVIPATYGGIQMLVHPNQIVTIPSGSYATTVQLANETAARMSADSSLNIRIVAIENFLPESWEDLFPAGFPEDFVKTDDERLHEHDNKDDLDQLDADDIARIKELEDHFASVGETDGLHVSEEDRERWNSNSVGNIDGGPPDAVYGGLEIIDEGEVV